MSAAFVKRGQPGVLSGSGVSSTSQEPTIAANTKPGERGDMELGRIRPAIATLLGRSRQFEGLKPILIGVRPVAVLISGTVTARFDWASLSCAEMQPR